MTRRPFHIPFYFVFLIAFFIGGPVKLTAQCDRSRDSMALVDLYQMTNGSEWTRKNNWLFAGNALGTWYGITTNAEGCVTEINLNSNKLRGPLTDSIVNLSELIKLNMSDNQLTIGNTTDSLPAGWSKMSKLEIINLSGNIFGGPVIAELGSVPNLKVLNLSLNYFTKNLPAQLGNSTSLRQLLLNQNDISGPIPSSFGQMINLEECILSQNLLQGTLPKELGNLHKLRVFSITQNQLTGTIPPELGNLSSVMFLYMNENLLDGSIPTSIGNLSNLRELWLNNNKLTGIIPQEIGQLSLLKKLLLNNNQLSGNLPSIITSLTSLAALHVSYNFISGTIPSEITSLINLESLHLDNNQLTGPIPFEIGKLQKLTSLRLHDNMISGNLPESLAEIPALKRIYFQNNQLEGCFPVLYRKFCPLKLNININANGYNFLGNDNLIFQGDFEYWCTSNYKIDASFTTNAPVCEGNSLRLYANASNLNYTWSGPEGFVSSLQNPIIPVFQNNLLGMYTLTVTDFNGCTATSTLSINNLITGSITANTPICEGKTIQLQASSGISYQWQGPQGFSSISQRPTIPKAGKVHEGTYTVEIQTSDCVITKQIDIELTSIGSVISADTACIGESIELKASGGVFYSWTGPNNFTSETDHPILNKVQPTMAGLYQVTISDNDGCQSMYDVYLATRQPDTLFINDIGFICAESDPLLLPSQQNQIPGTWIGQGISLQGNEYYFNPSSLSGEIPLYFQPDQSYNCLTAPPVLATIPELIVVSNNVIPNTSATDDNGSFDVIFEGQGNDFTLEWMGPTNGIQSFINPQTTSVSNVPSGLYSLSIKDQYGCVARNTVLVENLYYEIYFPNVLYKRAQNPENSVFTLYGNNISSYDVEVYDRWGSRVYSTYNAIPNDSANGWQIQDSNLQSGVYIVVTTVLTPAGLVKNIESLTIIE